MGKESATVEPEVLKGCQDLLPEDAIIFNSVVAKICKVVERFGFVPIDTPAIEYLATLIGTAGEETNKQIFRFKSPEHEDIGLRFDLTVPFARFLSQHLDELKLPFRRYHVSPVWRADKPGAGRFRQFTQFDFDAAGSANMAVDAEINRLMCDVMAELNVSEYVILINHRKLVDALLEVCDVEGEEKHKHILRVIDKLNKVGIEEIRKELGEGRIDESGDSIPGVGLEQQIIETIEKFLAVTGSTRKEVLEEIKQAVPGIEKYQEVFSEIEQYLEALESLGVDEDHVKLTPSLARGLDYYTGPLFETVLLGAPNFGSVMGGGRFDGLVSRFLGENIPATGVSIGISRFLTALKAIGVLEPVKTMTKVFVTVMDQQYMTKYLSIATELRNAGINTEVYLGKLEDKLRDQLSLANRREVPIAIIAGDDEFQSNTISIKDLRVGKDIRKDFKDRDQYVSAGKTGQITIPRTELLSKVQQILGGKNSK
jgi:histidyl-tRNA synthetase